MHFFKKRYFPALIVMLLASLTTVAHAFHRDVVPAEGKVVFSVGESRIGALNAEAHGRNEAVVAGVAADHHLPGERGHKEKRHGKSLISEAIVAEFLPLVQPEFFYCEHHYSPYLPGGSCQQVIVNYSLRGPPVVS